jgi:hypothetical protein
MTMKRAPSRVIYSGDVLAEPAIYPRSVPEPVALYTLAPEMVYELPSSIYKIEANANEDFDLSLELKYLTEDGTETPIDFGSTPVLEFYIRPRFDHSTIIKKLTVGAGIMVDDAAAGKLTLYMAQATVATDLLVSKMPAQHWDHFFNWINAGSVLELFRGPLVVHAGRYP